MAFVSADRVKETTTTTGAGDITLAGAMTGMRAFSSVMADGDTCYYTIQAVDGTGAVTGDWEVGMGTFHTGGTMSRTQIRSSSTGSILALASGTKQVWLDMPAKGAGPNTGLRGASAIVHFIRGCLSAGGVYVTSAFNTNGVAHCVQIRVPYDCIMAATAIVTTLATGGKQIVALYNQVPTTGMPGALAYTFSELDTSTIGQKTSTAQFVAAGDYWCFINQNAAPTLRALSGASSPGAGIMLQGDQGVPLATVTGGLNMAYNYSTPVTYSATPPSDLTTATFTALTNTTYAALFFPMFVVT